MHFHLWTRCCCCCSTRTSTAPRDASLATADWPCSILFWFFSLFREDSEKKLRFLYWCPQLGKRQRVIRQSDFSLAGEIKYKHKGVRECVLSCLALCGPMTVARQPPLSVGFPRQEYFSYCCGSVAQYRILLPMQETQVPCLGGEDPLEEGMATHSSNLAWRISRTEEPGGVQSTGSQRVKHGTSNFLESQLHIQEFCPSLIPGVETHSCEVKSLSRV